MRSWLEVRLTGFRGGDRQLRYLRRRKRSGTIIFYPDKRSAAADTGPHRGRSKVAMESCLGVGPRRGLPTGDDSHARTLYAAGNSGSGVGPA